MKWLHSIRWQMQLWHGLILLLVLAGFGFTAWQLQRANQLDRIDRELEQRIGIVAKAFHSPEASPSRPRGVDSDAFEPPPDWENRPSRGRWEFPRREMDAFESNPAHPFYYVAWLPGGTQVAASASAPSGVPLPERIPGSPSFRSRGFLRECFHTGRGGECILVGRDIGEDLAGIRRFALLLAGAGCGVLMLGLLGGGWISGLALRPVGEISAAAARIAGGDLARRIRTSDSRSELGQLALDLNDTFARLESSFVRQAQFTADASHELRTPVTVVLTQTQSALARERSADEYRESLAACQRAAQRMRGVIEGLLTLARLDAGKAAPAPEPCALDQIVSETVELLGAAANAQNVVIELELASIQCIGNADQLAQVVFNLVSNAIHYNRPGGTVRVEVYSGSETAILSVRDSGHGIAPEDLPHVFERFYRADRSRSGSQGHSGLGLAIVKGIVEAHGGGIELSSKPEEGSAFTVRLPMEK